LEVSTGDVADAAGCHVPQADAVCAADVDRSTAPAMFRMFGPYVMVYLHLAPAEAVDGVPVSTYQDLYDACVLNRARAHTRRLPAWYESPLGFIDVILDSGSPQNAGEPVAEVHGDLF